MRTCINCRPIYGTAIERNAYFIKKEPVYFCKQVPFFTFCQLNNNNYFQELICVNP